jgi:hypothetical protein
VKTKYLVRFLNRIAHFEADLELVDVVNIASKKGLLSTKGTRLFDLVSPSKHPRLANRQSSDGGRSLAMKHLRRTVASSFLKDLYEDVGAYLTDLIAGAARNGMAADRLIGEHKVSFEANDILKCKSVDEIVGLVAQSVFRKLEDERSTLKVLQAIDKKLGLGVKEAYRTGALPFLEMRHLLVHQDGIVDDAFAARYPNFGSVGQPLDLGHQVIVAARDAIVAMVVHYDECVVAKNVLAVTDLQP